MILLFKSQEVIVLNNENIVFCNSISERENNSKILCFQLLCSSVKTTEEHRANSRPITLMVGRSRAILIVVGVVR